MVGYRISPLLWAKVKRGLSAGRVQSVALRMICDREEEINAFIPEEYWTLDAQLHVHGSRKKLTAHYYGDKDGRKAIHSKEEVETLMKRLEGCEYEVRDVKTGRAREEGADPVYDQYAAAGGIQDAEFLNAEDDAPCPAAL